MRAIAFVSDLGVHVGRAPYDAILRAIVDPVLAHLPEAQYVPEPVPGALNVRFFVIVRDGKYDVFVGHGLADKAYSHWGDVRQFPYVFCSGPTWFARYLEQGATPDRLRITGFPKLDPIFNGEVVRGDGPRILWAPTHPTSWPYDYDRVQAAVYGLPFRVGRSPHPKLTSRPTLQALADADVVIADGGSTLYEAWALGKPVVFPSWIVRESRMLRPETLERHIYTAGLGYHARNQTDFAHQIRRALSRGMREPEREFIEGILPTHLRGTSGKTYADTLREIAKES